MKRILLILFTCTGRLLCYSQEPAKVIPQADSVLAGINPKTAEKLCRQEKELGSTKNKQKLKNYSPALKDKLTHLNNPSIRTSVLGTGWQESALFGITKKQKVGKKKVSMQLLYDFFHTKYTPQGQGFVFRVGYSS